MSQALFKIYRCCILKLVYKNICTPYLECLFDRLYMDVKIRLIIDLSGFIVKMSYMAV